MVGSRLSCIAYSMVIPDHYKVSQRYPQIIYRETTTAIDSHFGELNKSIWLKSTNGPIRLMKIHPC